MPKRTNEFQKLVYLVKQHVAVGATVTESKMLRERSTGREREVDICIDAVIAGHQLTVAIECMAEAGGADVTWIDEMIGKHRDLPTHRLVLASKSGFSSGAIAKAQSCGIELISIDRMNAEEAERLFGLDSSLYLKSFELKPTKVVMHVAASDALDAENVAVMPNNIIHDHNGQRVGFVWELVKMLLESENAMRGLIDPGDESHEFFELIMDPMMNDPDGNPFCLQKLDPPVLRPIKWIRIRGTCNFDISKFKLSHGKLKDVGIAWGASSFQGRQTLLVASSDQEGTKVSLTPLPLPKEKKK